MRQQVIDAIHQRIAELNETNHSLSGECRNDLLRLANKLKNLQLNPEEHTRRATVVKLLSELRDARLWKTKDQKGPKVFGPQSFPTKVVSAIMQEG